MDAATEPFSGLKGRSINGRPLHCRVISIKWLKSVIPFATGWAILPLPIGRRVTKKDLFINIDRSSIKRVARGRRESRCRWIQQVENRKQQISVKYQ
jgi:hypothetical protein